MMFRRTRAMTISTYSRSAALELRDAGPPSPLRPGSPAVLTLEENFLALTGPPFVGAL
jgi:hypothetical protein